MKTFFSSLVLLLLAASFAPAQDSAVQSVLDRYADFRPAAKDLVMYQIDWAPSLAEAQKRALREKRPVFLVIIHAQYGDDGRI
tara:strand:- start:24 stop:272 length:249 start_codon:yes stop_codon:yes gene_type:complete